MQKLNGTVILSTFLTAFAGCNVQLGRSGNTKTARKWQTDNWAGAVMQKLLAKCRKCQKSKGGTDRQTDGPTQ